MFFPTVIPTGRHRTGITRPKKSVSYQRPRLTGLMAAVLGCVLLAPAASAAPSQEATFRGLQHVTPTASENNLGLGPTVIRTNEPPTGFSVTFRYEAPPGVESVQIFGEWLFTRPEAIVGTTIADFRWGADWQPGDVLSGPWQTAQMTQGSDGIWSWTTPLPSGTFSYTFTHDCTSPTAANCARFIDPANPGWSIGNAPGTEQTLSQVYVPQNPRFPTYDKDYQAPVKPARLGTLEQRAYMSPTTTDPDFTRYLSVYLPAGYDPDREVPYPTLYISHGAGGNDSDWTTQGAAQYILENAIADKDAQPMVIVGTNANGIPGGNLGFVNDLRDNVIPFVESSYNVGTNPGDRAFGGLSAGGLRANTILYDHAGLFEYYGAWSALSFGPGLPNATQLEQIRGVAGGIHIGTGLQDYLISIGPNSVARAEFLRANGIDVSELNMNGSHTWAVWRPLLDDFIRTVAFRTTSTEIDVTMRRTHVRFTASVEALSTSTTPPSGEVEFWAGETFIGSARLQRDGSATLGVPLGTTYTGPVTARYVGDRFFNPSTSSPLAI